MYLLKAKGVSQCHASLKTKAAFWPKRVYCVSFLALLDVRFHASIAVGAVMGLAVSLASPELLSAGWLAGPGISGKPRTHLCSVSSPAPACQRRLCRLSFSSKEEACSSAAGLSGWDVTGAAAEAGLESGAQLTAGTCSVVPQVLQSCAEFIEQHGVVQGIYRLSGVASKIQKLR